MNKRHDFLLALILLFGSAWVVAEETETSVPEDETSVEATVGYQGSTLKDSRQRVAEFEVVEPNPLLTLTFKTSPFASTLFTLDLDHVDNHDMTARAELDWKRVIELDLAFDALLHRLDHDTLANLQAVSDVKVVRSTDFEPGAVYDLSYDTYHADFRARPPGAPWLTLRAGIRDQTRQGYRQQLTTSHCTSCHTTSQGRLIDESTQDLTLGVHARAGIVDLDYQLLDRRFESDAATPTAPYERAYHPGLPAGPAAGLQTPFNDRLWFQNGDFPVGPVPEVERLVHTLKAAADLKGRGALKLTVVGSETDNIDAGLNQDFRGYHGRYALRAGKRVRLTVDARHTEIETDDRSFDLLALNGLASAPVTMYPGFATPLTYQEWRRLVEGDPTLNFESFVRASAADRTDDRLGVDVKVRQGKNNWLRFGYRMRNVDRDNVVLADGTGETESHRLKLGWSQRPAPRLRWNNTLTYESVDNPYVSDGGGLRAYDALFSGTAPSPKSPLSLQYYQLHMLRVANLGNVPTNALRLRSSFTWSPEATWAVSGNLRYTDSENDELNFSDWQQDELGFGVNLWVASGPRFQCNLGLDHRMEKTETLFVVPVMDG